MVFKKGQAGVVAVVLLVLIALVFVILFWNFFNLFISDKSENIDGELLNVKLDLKEAILFVTGSSKVSLSRSGGDLEGLRFAFYSEDGEVITRDVFEVPKELETKEYSFSPIGFKISKISVMPISKSGSGIASDILVKDVFEMPESLERWDRNKQNIFLENENLIFDNEISICSFFNGEGELVKGKNFAVEIRDNKGIFSYFSNGNPIKIESYEFLTEDENFFAISLRQNGIRKIYINGEEAGEFKIVSDIPDILDEEIRAGENFNGEIRELMIFNKELSREQIIGIYNNFKI